MHKAIKILIIDDNSIDSYSYKRYISKTYTDAIFFIAETAEEGLKLYNAEHPDIILLDYNLPDLTGIEFLNVISTAKSNPSTGIIILTGQGNETVAVEAMKSGAHDYLIKSEISISRLCHAIKTSLEKIQSLHNATKKNKTLKSLAYYDQLTKLFNRFSFEELFKKSLALAKRENKILALLYIDLDGFKAVNDSHGHQTGDLLLEAAAKRLKNSSREGDIVARIGGDEFAIILNGVKSLKDAEVVAQKIIASLTEPFFIDGKKIEIGASIGIACYPDCSCNMQELMQNADSAMYRAKKGHYSIHAHHIMPQNIAGT